MINWWEFRNNLLDNTGGATLFGGINYSFVPDRFCTLNSAIYLNSGYLQVPNGVYFSGSYASFTVWIYLKSYQYYSRIFDFGNGPCSDNVGLAMFETSSQIYGLTCQNSSKSFKSLKAQSIINLNQWYFVAFVLSGTSGYIYVNGSLITNGTLFAPNNIIRTNNYIGKSNRITDSNADAIYDEIKIYQGALSSSAIMNEYNIQSNYGIILKF